MKVLKPLAALVSLKGKRALITGSAGGIGKVMAYRFAEAGADLELVDVKRAGGGKERTSTIRFENKRSQGGYFSEGGN